MRKCVDEQREASRGIPAPTYSTRLFARALRRDSYGPETNWTYEIGVKTEMFNNRFRLNANYFVNRGTDITLNANVIVNGNPTFPIQNAGNVTIKGLELESTAILFEGFTAFVTGTFLDGRFREIDPITAPANSMAAFGVEAEPPRPPTSRLLSVLTMSVISTWAAGRRRSNWAWTITIPTSMSSLLRKSSW